MEKITSVKNPAVRALRDLKDRRTRVETGRILVEGEVMIREALKCGLTPCDLLAEERFADFAAEMAGHGARCFEVPRSLLEAVCETKSPQGVCASFTAPQPRSVGALGGAVVALDGVQDPGNVGTIWRTCDAAAFDGLLLSNSCPDEFSPKVLRASMGAAFRVPALRVDLEQALGELRGQGCAVVSSQLDGAPFFEGLPGGDVALVIGNEARGVSEGVRALATHRLKLPMPGLAESLNAAVAAGIMIYACISGRR